ncbi:MAG: calcium-binding protein [Leptolyngbya sp. SIO1D8]|nr:calcium-binding protein [Leptolyngbya sp. SIO1D8]
MFSDQNNAPKPTVPGQESSPLNLDTLQDSSTLENLAFDKHPTALNAWEEDYVSEALNRQRAKENARLVGTRRNDLLEGGASADLIAGKAGDDVILGLDGADVLRGDRNRRSPGGSKGGDDIIFGGEGDDRIGGKGGNDALFGGEGNDQIWGSKEFRNR